jgi:hypothetical protein
MAEIFADSTTAAHKLYIECDSNYVHLNRIAMFKVGMHRTSGRSDIRPDNPVFFISKIRPDTEFQRQIQPDIR